MLSAAGSALVAGSVRAEMSMSNAKVKALRGFRGIANGQFREVKPGETVEVPEGLARDLIHSKKAERAVTSLESADIGAASESDAKRGGKSNVGK